MGESGRASLTLLRAPASIFAGKLPNSVRLRQGGGRSATVLEVRLEREVSGDEQSGACSMVVRVSCPFVLVNRTHLPVAFAPEAVSDAEEQSQRGGGADRDGDGAGSAAAVVTVSTAVPGREGGAKMEGEMVMGPGKQALLSPPGVKEEAVGICVRVGGSGTSMPIRLSGGSATVVNAVLPDLKLCQARPRAAPPAGFGRSRVPR